MSLEATTLVNTIRPNQDEAHRERLTSGQGKCQSFGGVMPLKPKQECVAHAMPALNPDLCTGSVDAMAAHDKRHLKAKLLAESKPSKMSLVEEATPQAFKEAAGTSSVSNRRKQAELKHLARIARARCAHR
mmetsp:Transcript_26868/g.55003  ORF Transcript_26868/g.55003 Transcript_26868/m.55003 type:complete len:131 (+) Transcript_26868:461-853(+)